MLACRFSFSDIENVDWLTIKSTLSSSDSWSICRLGDYFVKHGKNKRRRHDQHGNRKDKPLKHSDQSMIVNEECSNSDSSTDEYDMLDDIYGDRALFRIMPQISSQMNQHIQPIVEPGWNHC
jgi:hypothetical protein